MKKLTKEDFEDLLGGISASSRFVFNEEITIGSLLTLCRYDNLNITGTHVNVRYDSDSGEFKFSGSYGRGY